MNLNMQAFNINTLLGGLDKVRDVMGVYQQQLLLIVIVFALLNCFFGYALRKLWSVIPGFFLGAAAGYAAGTYTNQTTTITLALAVGTGLLTAIIAFVLYRIGLFLLICGLVGFCLWHLVNPNDITGYGLVALVAFVISLICVPFERISVILVTSICGALTTIRMAYFFKDLDLNMMFWIASAILAAAGMLFQFKPWKEADYWEDDDEEEREHRAKARARRKRRSSFDPLPSRKKKRNAAAPLPLLPATQEIRTAAIRNRRTVPVFRRTPCTISVLFRKNLTMTTMRKIFRKSSAAGHPQTGRSGGV